MCKKGITTHIKEIRAFQKYFEASYRPDDLSRTICEATFILKDKFLEKLPDLKIPSCVKPENKFQLAFRLQPPKFPRLPSADLGLTFGPPFPKWFICEDSIKLLRQDSLKLTKQVVPTKFTLDSFKGFLHVDMEHLNILTPILEGVKWEDPSICFF